MVSAWVSDTGNYFLGVECWVIQWNLYMDSLWIFTILFLICFTEAVVYLCSINLSKHQDTWSLAEVTETHEENTASVWARHNKNFHFATNNKIKKARVYRSRVWDWGCPFIEGPSNFSALVYAVRKQPFRFWRFQ